MLCGDGKMLIQFNMFGKTTAQGCLFSYSPSYPAAMRHVEGESLLQSQPRCHCCCCCNLCFSLWNRKNECWNKYWMPHFCSSGVTFEHPGCFPGCIHTTSKNCDNAGNCKTWFSVLLGFKFHQRSEIRVWISGSEDGSTDSSFTLQPPSLQQREEVWRSLSHGCNVWICVCAKKNLNTSNVCPRVCVARTDSICSWCRNTWALVSLIIQYALKTKSPKRWIKKEQTKSKRWFLIFFVIKRIWINLLFLGGEYFVFIITVSNRSIRN